MALSTNPPATMAVPATEANARSILMIRSQLAAAQATNFGQVGLQTLPLPAIPAPTTAPTVRPEVGATNTGLLQPTTEATTEATGAGTVLPYLPAGAGATLVGPTGSLPPPMLMSLPHQQFQYLVIPTHLPAGAAPGVAAPPGISLTQTAPDMALPTTMTLAGVGPMAAPAPPNAASLQPLQTFHLSQAHPPPGVFPPPPLGASIFPYPLYPGASPSLIHNTQANDLLALERIVESTMARQRQARYGLLAQKVEAGMSGTADQGVGGIKDTGRDAPKSQSLNPADPSPDHIRSSVSMSSSLSLSSSSSTSSSSSSSSSVSSSSSLSSLPQRQNVPDNGRANFGNGCHQRQPKCGSNIGDDAPIPPRSMNRIPQEKVKAPSSNQANTSPIYGKLPYLSSTNTPRKHHRRMDTKWNENFEKLVEFKKRHGHVNVPHAVGKLGTWVNSQRNQYKEYLNLLGGGKPKQFSTRPNGKPIFRTVLSPDRIHKLNSIGFRWQIRACHVPWEKRYKELAAYKEQFGTTDVPIGFHDTKGLARWLKNQRIHYAKKKQGKPTRLSDEQVEKMNKLNFTW